MQHLEFENLFKRLLIGPRSNMLTNTSGEAVMAHRFFRICHGKDDLGRDKGVLISKNQEKNYRLIGLINCRDRGRFCWTREKKYMWGKLLRKY